MWVHEISRGLSNPLCPSDLLRHLDYFEMLRNEDELALSKRYESVSEEKKKNHDPDFIFLEFWRMYSCAVLFFFAPSPPGTYRYQKCHPSFWSHPQEDEPHRCISALYVCAASLSPHATWVILYIWYGWTNTVYNMQEYKMWEPEKYKEM